MSFSSLKDLMPKAASKLQLQGEMKSAVIVNRASKLIKDLLPEEVHQGIRVQRFTDGVLWLAVKSASVAQEVLLKSFTLKNRINSDFDQEMVQSIRTFQETPDPEEDHSRQIDHFGLE